MFTRTIYLRIQEIVDESCCARVVCGMLYEKARSLLPNYNNSNWLRQLLYYFGQ